MMLSINNNIGRKQNKIIKNDIKNIPNNTTEPVIDTKFRINKNLSMPVLINNKQESHKDNLGMPLIIDNMRESENDDIIDTERLFTISKSAKTKQALFKKPRCSTAMTKSQDK
jgi:hypothetical protein